MLLHEDDAELAEILLAHVPADRQLAAYLILRKISILFEAEVTDGA